MMLQSMSNDIEEASNIMMARVSETKHEFCKKVSHSCKKYNLPWLNENLDYNMKREEKRKFQEL